MAQGKVGTECGSDIVGREGHICMRGRVENERDENLKYLHMKSQFIVSSKSYYGACKKKKQKLR